MIAFCRVAVMAIIALCGFFTIAASAQPIATLASGLGTPAGLALDPGGNLFVTERNGRDYGQISELAVADHYSTVRNFENGMGLLSGVVIDGQGNLFLADPDHGAVKEFLAADDYTTIKTIGEPMSDPVALAIDSAGDIFVGDLGANTVIEMLSAEGYATNHSLGGGFYGPGSLALDPNGNLFVTDIGNDVVKEILAADGYTTVKTLPYIFHFPGASAIVVDANDTIFVAQGYDIFRLSPADNYATAKIVGINFNYYPSALAMDTAGDIFVATTNQGIQEIPVAGGYASLVPIAPGLYEPIGMATDASGNLYVTDISAGVVDKLSPADGYVTAKPVLGRISLPGAIAVDGAGNIFATDGGTVYEIPVAGNVAVPRQLASGFNGVGGFAEDSSGNLFVTDTRHNLVKELLAASGYSSVQTLGSGFKAPGGIAVDAGGNVFVADSGNGVIKEIVAAGGYSTVNIVSYRPGDMPEFIAIDADDNLYVTYFPGDGSVEEFMAADGYRTIQPVGSGLVAPQSVAIDASGNVFVADGAAVKEILATAPTLVAAVLPGARSVQFGTPATVFATMINTGPNALAHCQVAVSPSAQYSLSPNVAPPSLTLDFQATDPTTNALIGTIDTPVTIPPNGGSASFLLAIQGTPQGSGTYNFQDMPLDFFCDANGSVAGNRVETAAVVPGIDTLDLVLSSDPVTDIIALAATATNNGIVDLPKGGAGAFAVASVNLGQANTLAVSVDTGGATLPLTATICQTDPSTGQCVAPAAASTTLNFATNATPTFSVFLQATGTIPFAPDSSRVFVRFTDLGGVLHGSTSIAVSAD